MPKHLIYALNNVNFETGTINSKRELWPKNPKKSSKTVLKTKSVDARITTIFFLGKFSTCFKNGGENQFFVQKLSKKHPQNKKC